MNEDIQEEPIV